MKAQKGVSGYLFFLRTRKSSMLSSARATRSCATSSSQGSGARGSFVRILICVNGGLKHVNTPDSYLRERCAKRTASVLSVA